MKSLNFVIKVVIQSLAYLHRLAFRLHHHRTHKHNNITDEISYSLRVRALQTTYSSIPQPTHVLKILILMKRIIPPPIYLFPLTPITTP